MKRRQVQSTVWLSAVLAGLVFLAFCTGCNPVAAELLIRVDTADAVTVDNTFGALNVTIENGANASGAPMVEIKFAGVGPGEDDDDGGVEGSGYTQYGAE